MEGVPDGERVAASLAGWLAGVTFADLGADEVTDLLVGAVVAWAEGQRSLRSEADRRPVAGDDEDE